MAKVIVENVRLAFPSVFEASSYENGPAKFSAKFPIAPGSANAKKLDAALRETAKEKWGAKGDTVFAGLVKTGKTKNLEVCFAEQPYTNRDGEVYDGFEDQFFLTASNKVRPLVLDKDKSPLVAADGRPYAGCYVNAVIEIWGQDNQHGRALRAELKGVQFVKDGDAFSGGGAASPDDFGDLTAGADAELV